MTKSTRIVLSSQLASLGHRFDLRNGLTSIDGGLRSGHAKVWVDDFTQREVRIGVRYTIPFIGTTSPSESVECTEMLLLLAAAPSQSTIG